MRPLIADPPTPSAVRLGDTSEPVPKPHEVVVDVHHVALNRGDLNDARSGRLPAGAVLGSDVAGIVRQAAAAGGGPEAGTCRGCPRSGCIRRTGLCNARRPR